MLNVVERTPMREQKALLRKTKLQRMYFGGIYLKECIDTLSTYDTKKQSNESKNRVMFKL
jgi:hypothetical protein